MSHWTDLEIFVISCNFCLTLGCAIATWWVSRWRRRLVLLNLLLEDCDRELDRILHPLTGQMAQSRPLVQQLRQIYHRQLKLVEQLRQILWLLGLVYQLSQRRRR